MPLDSQRLIQNKDMIISTLENKGPSLPVHIARSINVSILFASAFLSELYGEKRVLMSNMKVGSTSLYYLVGQEAQLENFIQYLNPKEKEAFHLLKKGKLLKDELQEPAIRVALRQLKDFAQPVKIIVNNESKTFWKYFLLTDQETEQIAQQFIIPEKKEVQEPKNPQEHSAQQAAPQIHKEKIPRKPRISTQAPLSEHQRSIMLPLPGASLGASPAPLSPFAQQIQTYLQKKEITLHQIIEDKKKEVTAKVSITTPLGKQAFYLIAKDKKRIKEDELIQALQKAHAEKMPALVLALGDVEKKAQSLLQEWSALMKFEKIS